MIKKLYQVITLFLFVLTQKTKMFVYDASNVLPLLSTTITISQHIRYTSTIWLSDTGHLQFRGYNVLAYLVHCTLLQHVAYFSQYANF